MAMTNLTWHYVTIAALADPPWSAGTYAASSFVVDAITFGTAVLVFCISDAGLGGSAIIAYDGGTATIPSGAVTVSSTPAMDTTTFPSGEVWYSVRGATVQWYWYSDISGVVAYLDDSTTLGAFIA